MQEMSENLEIKCFGSQLVLSCDGNIGSDEVVISEGDAEGGLEMESKPDDEEIVQGKFELKYLIMFTKATNLNSQVKLYLKNDYPLILEYAIGTLGSVKFFLASVNS